MSVHSTHPAAHHVSSEEEPKASTSKSAEGTSKEPDNASKKRTSKAIEDAKVPSSSEEGGDAKRPRTTNSGRSMPDSYVEENHDIYDDPTDRTYDRTGILKKRNKEPGNYPLEQSAADASGPYTRHELGSGPYSTTKGRYGDQPFIQTRKTDYNKADVGLDYDDIVRVLNQDDPDAAKIKLAPKKDPDDPDEEGEDAPDADYPKQEKMASDMLEHTKGKDVDFSGYTDEERRAMTHLMAITQVAEEHPNRTPGSAPFARASLKRIADGDSTFGKEFSRGKKTEANEGDRAMKGNYVPAHVGGTGKMRKFVQSNENPNKEDKKVRNVGARYTAANMSDDEDDEPSRRRSQSEPPPDTSRQVKTNKGKERAE